MKKKTISKLISIILILSMLLCTFPAYAADGPKTISFKYLTRDTAITLDTRYDEQYFSNSSFKYNHNLAYLSLCTALASFSATTDDWGEVDPKTRYANLDNIYTQMGFTSNTYYHYGRSLNSTADSAAFSIAENEKLGIISIAVRGGGYGAEWSSNLKLGDGSQDHIGFDLASDEIADELIKLIEDRPDGIKIWITGYSRGAAIANAAASKLNRYAEKSGKLQKEDIYAYTFAAPQGIYKSSATDDNNIFNIVNPGDPVTYLSPGSWGYGRNGIDLEFNFNTDKASLKKVCDRFYELSGQTLSIEDNLANKGLTASILTVLDDVFGGAEGTSIFQNTMSMYLEYINYESLTPAQFYAILRDERGYGSKVNKSIEKADSYLSSSSVSSLIDKLIEKEIGKDASKSEKAIARSLVNSYVKPFTTFWYLNDGKSIDITRILSCLIEESNTAEILLTDISALTHGHYTQLYIAAMENLNFAEDSCRVMQIDIEGPVEASIYSSSGKKMTDMPTVKYGDKTSIFLDVTHVDKYTVKVASKKAGSLKYSVKELSCGGKVLNSVAFSKVSVTKGKTISGSIYGDVRRDTIGKAAKSVLTLNGKSRYSIGSSISLSAASYTYSGKARKPSVTVKKNGKFLKEGTDYKVSYSHNTGVGKAAVTITGIGSYMGKSTRTFTILPKGTSIVSAKKKNSTIAVKWKKASSKVSGYQIKYSTSSSMKKSKTYTVKGYSKTTYTLKAKKGYFMIRTYKKVDDKTYYSSWSKVKKAK